ncbi:MAG: hypothetical protein M3R25_07995 [Bacteroidota bacterium]|nr:hypothetical protein [Bacteroidota bacterium]
MQEFAQSSSFSVIATNIPGIPTTINSLIDYGHAPSMHYNGFLSLLTACNYCTENEEINPPAISPDDTLASHSK